MRVGIAAVVVLAAGAAFAVGRLALKNDPASSEEPTETEAAVEAPSFFFALDSASSVSTAARVGSPEATRETARAVRKVLNELYRKAFLDPSTWEGGSFDAALEAFDTDAYGDATADLESLTLGTGARYERVQPGEGTLSVTVLLGPDGQPVTAEATVSFSATAIAPTGAETLIVSDGSFFLRSTPEGWKIYGYEVDRADQPAGGEA
jgi:hypothetical protein